VSWFSLLSLAVSLLLPFLLLRNTPLAATYPPPLVCLSRVAAQAWDARRPRSKVIYSTKVLYIRAIFYLEFQGARGYSERTLRTERPLYAFELCNVADDRGGVCIVDRPRRSFLV